MTKIVNKKAFHNYQILEKYEAGIELKGSEIKSVRAGRANISVSFAKILKGKSDRPEVFLINLVLEDVPEPSRTRKLLLHKKEINRLLGKTQEKRLTLVPLSLYFTCKGIVKVSLGLGKGKTRADRREELKRRDLERELKTN